MRNCVTELEIGDSHSCNCDYCTVLLGRQVLTFRMYVTAFNFREEVSVTKNHSKTPDTKGEKLASDNCLVHCPKIM